MTTSPSPTPAVANGSTPVSPETLELTEERTTTIGWFFIQSYYDFFVNKLDTIHKIYHANAILSHDAYPQNQVPAITHTAKGIDAIKSRFASEQASTNRIVITSATFQTSLDKNIIIVAFGEWAKGDDKFCQFTQTFVLTPGKKENTFDVANDILKFIDVNGFNENSEAVEPVVEPEVVEEPVVVEEVKVEEEKVEEEEANITEETAVESEPVEEEKEETQEEEPVNGSTEEVKEEAKEEPKEEEVETVEEAPAASAASAPAKPLSWADLASQSSAKAASKATSPSATSSAGNAKPPASAASTSTSTTTAITSKKVTSPTGSSPTTNTGKFKKEDWFPIYIRGIKQLDEKSLKDHLSQQFGELKFFKVIQNIALCDFVAQDAQTNALETKETTLDGVTFQLEPRESKTGNNYHNGKYSSKYNKDGNQEKRNSDDISDTPTSNIHKSRKPPNTAFRQQRLKAWQPILTPKTVIPLLILVAVVFAPLGIAILYTTYNVEELSIDYSECNKLKVSVDSTGFDSIPRQLKGVAVKDGSITDTCKPLKHRIINGTEKLIYPCGLIANSYFNDTFTSPVLLNAKNGQDNQTYVFGDTGISWPSDRNHKFQPTQYTPDQVVPPPNWDKMFPQGYTNETMPNLQTWEHLQNWMRTAALPSFYKLYGKNTTETMSSGTYEIEIGLNYPVSIFGGTKSVVITTNSIFGGRNVSIGVIYIIVAIVCLVLGIGFLLQYLIKPRKSTPGQAQAQVQVQQQQQTMSGPTGQSPPISQLQLQHQQLQRQQQLLNQHLQQSQQSQQLGTPTGQHVNPLLAGLNGTGTAQPTNGTGLLMNNSVNPVLQMQLQQQQQQQQQVQAQAQQAQFLQAQQLQHLQQAQAQAVMQQQSQIPIIKQVWSHNLEVEFHSLRNFINDKTANIFISIHQEIPGIVARPIGTFKSSSDYHFQTLRSNADLLNIVQLSLCIIKLSKNGGNIRTELNSQRSIIWQFNFFYDLTKEMYNEEHLAMLSQTSQINFQLHMTQGIPHVSFAELMIESGLLLDHQHINWISYHAGYDLGFFISLMMNSTLPIDEKEFSWWCSKYFPNFYDLKYIGNQILSNKSNEVESKTNKPSIEYLAEELHLLPISPAIRQHFNSTQSSQQQMTSTLHAYLSMECFKELVRQSGFDIALLTRYKGFIWGLGTLSETAEERQNGSTATPTPGTPGSKGLYGRS
ncbi:Cell division control protein 50 [Spathaspora sp. JA1]|nr:Cell division control protein 50 [Spathaspora sp. JA1]